MHTHPCQSSTSLCGLFGIVDTGGPDPNLGRLFVHMNEVATPLILAPASYTNLHPHLARLTVLLPDKEISCVPMTLVPFLKIFTTLLVGSVDSSSPCRTIPVRWMTGQVGHHVGTVGVIGARHPKHDVFPYRRAAFAQRIRFPAGIMNAEHEGKRRGAAWEF